MMMEEFTNLTGCYPDATLYRCIEDAYYAADDDKKVFCANYTANKDGLADHIRQMANEEAYKQCKQHDSEVEALKKQIAMLEKMLDRELEWKPFEEPGAATQRAYESIARRGQKMTDEAAACRVALETGFEKSAITITHEIAATEINRHGVMRGTGKQLDRSPVSASENDYYIRFVVHSMTGTNRCYELEGGVLTKIW